ncbi:SH3 domain-containing protein [Roseobacter sp. N2S]|uniref:SH3 domain-containing protein n=1 Tax=Roseobacter sp. N2S TaxID=2663844 RepID=UPI00285BDE6D|nr:SH3 domain-containing protein [Roseobacter sp. N2S]MDR6267453.1 hypothetical protein [Roseobacter sp. N2S]
MTRIFNITLLLCLAAVFYVQNITQKPTVQPVPIVQSAVQADGVVAAKPSEPAQATAAQRDIEQSGVEQSGVKQSDTVTGGTAQFETRQIIPDPDPDPEQKVLVVMSPKPEPAATAEPPVGVSSTLEDQENAALLDTAEIQARFAAAAVAERSQLDFEETPIDTSAVNPAPLAQAAPKRWRVTGRLVNARAAPSTESAILDKLVRGTIVEDTGEVDGLWSRVIVQDSGTAVWMHRNFLEDQS